MARDPNHLTPRGDGRFCKRVRGKLHYFGANGDRDQALKEWLEQKDDLLAGRVPRPRLTPPDQITVGEVVNLYVFAMMQRRQAGEITPGTYGDYFRACTEFANFNGLGARAVASLTPDDFAAVRAAWSDRLAAWALDRHVQAVRTMFNHAVDTTRVLDRAPWYGDRFGKTTEGAKRAEEAEAVRRRGERLFAPAELSAILYGRPGAGDGVPGVSGQLRAMVWLALNGGMNATDCAHLRRDHVRRERVGDEDVWVVDFIRGKTAGQGVRWTFPLWPETKAELDRVAESRPTPRRPADAALVFLTAYGRPWASVTITRDADRPDMEVGGRENVQIHQAFTRRLDDLGIRRDRVAFGAFRHTHVSATADHPDQNARYRVRGHKFSGIEKHYDKIPLPRLKAVTDLARTRLLPP
jgi:hypothetical protein